MESGGFQSACVTLKKNLAGSSVVTWESRQEEIPESLKVPERSTVKSQWHPASQHGLCQVFISCVFLGLFPSFSPLPSWA